MGGCSEKASQLNYLYLNCFAITTYLRGRKNVPAERSNPGPLDKKESSALITWKRELTCINSHRISLSVTNLLLWHLSLSFPFNFNFVLRNGLT